MEEHTGRAMRAAVKLMVDHMDMLRNHMAVDHMEAVATMAAELAIDHKDKLRNRKDMPRNRKVALQYSTARLLSTENQFTN